MQGGVGWWVGPQHIKHTRLRLGPFAHYCAMSRSVPPPALQDILKKEDGLYIKYAMGSVLQMRYQVRRRH